MISFTNIRSTYKDAKLLSDWRSSSYLQNRSLTTIKPNLRNQITWLKNSSKKDNYCHWFIKFKKKKIGWICITEPDFLTSSIRWGYYVGEKKYQYLGSIVPLYLYNFIFLKLNYKLIIAETLSNNINMTRVLKFHGFKRIKTIKNFLLRNERYLNKYNFNLSKENWIKQKKFHSYNYDFKMTNTKKKTFTLKN